ncbi:MAG: CHAT domain-containing protein [Haliscomenobacteraceae bacterium CHB4]|nr:hypothetical protein [Saprospiraceae bacterium]MCE7922219.1 CHAT domain-containing protein [Haliscomenobacteraceae bacterium CHB4]
MKNAIALSALFLFSLPVFCQNADSLAAMRQVDSLLQISRALTEEGDFDKSLEVNVAAEKLALEKFGRESASYGSVSYNYGVFFLYKRDFTTAEKWFLGSKDIREKVFGKEHRDYATSLNGLANLYSKMGDSQKAEPLYLEALAIREKTLGKEHPDYVASLLNLARFYWKTGNFEKAEPRYVEALAIKEKAFGKEHADYALVMNDLAILYQHMGEYEKAEPLFLESKNIREKTLGKEHPDYAASLNNLAILLMEIGNYEKAELLYVEALAIKEKLLGKEHADYALGLNNMANLYYLTSNYEKAESLYIEALALRGKILGKEHPQYGQNLGNLANLYAETGKYEKAEPLYREAITILEKASGKEHPDYATSSDNLAILYQEMGNYEKAEALFAEVLAIQEKVLRKEHPDYAASLSNLASLYWDMGNYEKAEPFLVEALNLREKTWGKEHPDYAWSLNNLALLYWKTGRYEKSEPLYLEALAIREKSVGKEHPHYAANLNNLASLYKDMGSHQKAEALHIEALAIREKALGKEHPSYAASLSNLANLYSETGKYEKAGQLQVEALAIQEKALGKEHPDYASVLANLAVLYWANCKSDTARQVFLKSAEIEKSLLTKASFHLSEQELSLYGNKLARWNEERLSFAQKHSEMSPSSYDYALFRKGFLLNAVSQVGKLALADSASAEKYYLLKSYHRRLAKEYATPLAGRDSAKIADLEKQANTLEKELTRTVAGFGEAIRQVTWKEVQTALRPDEAAIEFVRYKFFNPLQTDSVMYAALLLRPGWESPHRITLFEEKQIDTLLRVTGERKADFVSKLYTLVSRGIAENQKSLYELLWQSLEKELDGVKTVYYSPSGLLHQINLGALPMRTDFTLADKYELVQLGSTRQLVVGDSTFVADAPAFAGASAVNTAILFGGIRYEMDSAAIYQAYNNLKMQPTPTDNLETLSFAYTDSLLRSGVDWNYLPYTEKEVDAIEQIIKSGDMNMQLYKGYVATEESFKRIGQATPSPRVLHIATHGFFFPDPKDNPQSPIPNPQSDEPVFKISDHPMIRSGLLLAGANHAWQTGKPLRPHMEDGILTAYEISQMNLSNTELVVLSACETGLGQIQGNEGVYGLQRAFKIAGAKYLIMSLWQVPDQQTSLLMTTFYKKWLEEKMEIPEAFRAAQKAMREQGFDPYQWAGFVLVE